MSRSSLPAFAGLLVAGSVLLVGCASTPDTAGSPNLITGSQQDVAPHSSAASLPTTAPAMTAPAMIAPAMTAPRPAPDDPPCTAAALTSALKANRDISRTIVLGKGLRFVECHAGWAVAATSPPTYRYDAALVIFQDNGGRWVVITAGTGDLCSVMPDSVRREFPDRC